MKLVVWTRAYRPFIMGGNVNAPVATEVEVGEAIDIGKGFKAYLIVSPVSGKTFVAEATTGAFIGGSITEVRDDMKNCTKKMATEQIAEAAEMRKTVHHLPPDEFWRMFRN